MTNIDAIEAAAFNAWPAFQHVFLDGWLLRLANGYTKRANSVNFVRPCNLPLPVLIDESERIFGARGLPSTFRLVGREETRALDEALDRRGYKRIDETWVMQANLADLAAPGNLSVLSQADWLPVYDALNDHPRPHQAEHERILDSIVPEHVYAALSTKEAWASCGLGVADRQYFGYFDIVTRADMRQRGHAERLMRGMADWALAHGASIGYLQVMKHNTAALALYRKLGYTPAYDYSYRIQTAQK